MTSIRGDIRIPPTEFDCSGPLSEAERLAGVTVPVRTMALEMLGELLVACSGSARCGCRPKDGDWNRERMRELACPLLDAMEAADDQA